MRRDGRLGGLERALQRSGFPLVAGTDEAGRGPCAGPLVVAAVVLPPGRRGDVSDLADSKLLPPAVREAVYARVLRAALSWSVVVVPAVEVDARGIHVVNLEGMRRAVAALELEPSYVLSDGFVVGGFGRPSLAVHSGDRVAASVAAASVVAKVTRDRLMVELDARHPGYGFAEHKGYTTAQHRQALAVLGPCVEHRWSWAPVRRGGGAVRGRSGRWEDGRVRQVEGAR